MSEVKKFLESLKNRALASELFPTEKPKNETEALDAYVKAAEKLGFSITAEELKAEIEENAAATAKETEDQIRKIPAEELDKVAGGGSDRQPCEVTYIEGEWCYWPDSCTYLINKYGAESEWEIEETEECVTVF